MWKTIYITWTTQLTSKIHKGEKSYECKECRKAFRLHSHLKGHHSIHTGEKPYEYKKCGKVFRQNSTYPTSLRTLKRMYTKEKPYKYKEYENAYRWNSTFNQHQKMHTNKKFCWRYMERPFNFITSLQIIRYFTMLRNQFYKWGVMWEGL